MGEPQSWLTSGPPPHFLSFFLLTLCGLLHVDFEFQPRIAADFGVRALLLKKASRYSNDAFTDSIHIFHLSRPDNALSIADQLDPTIALMLARILTCHNCPTLDQPDTTLIETPNFRKPHHAIQGV